MLSTNQSNRFGCIHPNGYPGNHNPRNDVTQPLRTEIEKNLFGCIHPDGYPDNPYPRNDVTQSLATKINTIENKINDFCGETWYEKVTTHALQLCQTAVQSKTHPIQIDTLIKDAKDALRIRLSSPKGFFCKLSYLSEQTIDGQVKILNKYIQRFIDPKIQKYDAAAAITSTKISNSYIPSDLNLNDYTRPPLSVALNKITYRQIDTTTPETLRRALHNGNAKKLLAYCKANPQYLSKILQDDDKAKALFTHLEMNREHVKILTGVSKNNTHFKYGRGRYHINKSIYIGLDENGTPEIIEGPEKSLSPRLHGTFSLFKPNVTSRNRFYNSMKIQFNTPIYYKGIHYEATNVHNVQSEAKYNQDMGIPSRVIHVINAKYPKIYMLTREVDGVDGLTYYSQTPYSPHDVATDIQSTRIKDISKLYHCATEQMNRFHEAGYVHRDIKPGNIIIKPQNTHDIGFKNIQSMTVIDPGLACLKEHMNFAGTPAYLTPNMITMMAKGTADKTLDHMSMLISLLSLLTRDLKTRVHSFQGNSYRVADIDAYLHEIRKSNSQLAGDIIQFMVNKDLLKYINLSPCIHSIYATR